MDQSVLSDAETSVTNESNITCMAAMPPYSEDKLCKVNYSLLDFDNNNSCDRSMQQTGDSFLISTHTRSQSAYTKKPVEPLLPKYITND